MPLRPQFRFYRSGELLWSCTDRAKNVAELIKRQKNEEVLGPKLAKEQVSFMGILLKKVLHFAGVESFIFWNAVFVIKGFIFFRLSSQKEKLRPTKSLTRLFIFDR